MDIFFVAFSFGEDPNPLWEKTVQLTVQVKTVENSEDV